MQSSIASGSFPCNKMKRIISHCFFTTLITHDRREVSTSAPFTRYRFHFTLDWFHIGLAFCLHDTVFIPYWIGLLFTRERTNPTFFIPFSRFQMKTLWKWHEANPISCKRSNPISTQYGTSLSILLASNPLGELRRMRSGTITEYGETITVQSETVSCKQEKFSYRIALPNRI